MTLNLTKYFGVTDAAIEVFAYKFQQSVAPAPVAVFISVLHVKPFDLLQLRPLPFSLLKANAEAPIRRTPLYAGWIAQ